MLGQTHSLSSAGVFLAAAFPISHYVHHLGPVPTVVGTVVAAGAGLLPDLDHPSATPARAFGPISQTAARIVCKVSGGHRHATHSLLGLAVATAGAVAASFSVIATTIVIWLCAGLGVRALWRRPKNRPNGRLDYGDVAGLVHAAVLFFVAWRVTHSGVDLWVVPVAVSVGYLVHLLGDAATESGVNWLWPDERRFRWASVDTGKSVERWVVVPLLYAGIGVVVWVTAGTWWPALVHAVTAR